MSDSVAQESASRWDTAWRDLVFKTWTGRFILFEIVMVILTYVFFQLGGGFGARDATGFAMLGFLLGLTAVYIAIVGIIAAIALLFWRYTRARRRAKEA